MKARIISIAKQLVLMAAVVVIIGYWQTRDVPTGAAPKVTVQTLAGMTYDLPAAIQQKVTLIYFFAPWCGVCRLSMGNLNNLQKWFPDISVQAVALDYESTEEVQKFIDDIQVRIPISIGNQHVRDVWGISAYPTYVLIGRDGLIHGASIGYSSQFGMILRVLWTKIIA